MKVLILGGTGAIGKYLVNLLAEDNFEVFITSRQKHNSTLSNVHYIQGNAYEEEFFNSVVSQHWNVIVDFMSYTTSFFVKRYSKFLEATDQYIFLSSARVYDSSEDDIVENSPRLLDSSTDKEFLNTDEYALAKAKQENILQSSDKKNWTIIRPYITYSSDRFQLGVLEKEEWLYRALKGKAIIFSNEISLKKTTMTHGLDVSRGIKALIGKEQACREVFHITANPQNSRTWKEIMDIYRVVLEKHLGKPPKIIMQDMSKFISLRPNQSKYQILYDRLFDSSKVSHYVEVNSFIKPEQGLKSCLEAFIKKPHFKAINWSKMGAMDKIAKERVSLKEINGLKNKVKYLINRNL